MTRQISSKYLIEKKCMNCNQTFSHKKKIKRDMVFCKDCRNSGNYQKRNRDKMRVSVSTFFNNYNFKNTNLLMCNGNHIIFQYENREVFKCSSIKAFSNLNPEENLIKFYESIIKDCEHNLSNLRNK